MLENFLIFSLFFTISHCLLIPLSYFETQRGNYTFGTSERVFVISTSSPDVLKELILTTELENVVSDANILSTPQPDGSLTPFTTIFDRNTLNVNYYNPQKPLSGYLYIYSMDNNNDLNVFPILENSNISFKTGKLNVFFRMTPMFGKNTIPVARNLKINKNVEFQGFVGLPDDGSSPVKFFDSSSLNCSFYNQLELPMEKFYFSTNGIDIQYQIQYSERLGVWKSSAGLLMTDNYPVKFPNIAEVTSYLLGNSDQSELIMIPRLSHSQSYIGEITIFYEKLDPFIFPMFSLADTYINSTGPMNRILVNCTGPYAIQYTLTDLLEATTQGTSDNFKNFGMVLMVIVVFWI